MHVPQGLPRVLVQLLVILHVVGALARHVVNKSLVLLDLLLPFSQRLSVVIVNAKVFFVAAWQGFQRRLGAQITQWTFSRRLKVLNAVCMKLSWIHVAIHIGDPYKLSSVLLLLRCLLCLRQA